MEWLNRYPVLYTSISTSIHKPRPTAPPVRECLAHNSLSTHYRSIPMAAKAFPSPVWFITGSQHLYGPEALR